MKTAVSEAVTNAIVHGYHQQENGEVEIEMWVGPDGGGSVRIEVSDAGCGIANLEQAMQPFYTSRAEMERAGMGFAVMQTFMDSLDVSSHVGEGTRVTMTKRLGGHANG